MKKFKELKSDLAEGYPYGVNTDWGNSYQNHESDVGTFYIERPDQLERLNNFIEAFLGREFIDPKLALNSLRTRLNQTGVDFSRVPDVVQEGHLEFEVTRNGGSFGTTPEHDLLKDGFYKDSGVPGMNFTLKADVVPSGGAYRISAEIVPTETE
tara:strand:+ start:439 stop:900 length:462 start_codon:yes stop_codon:yes gene_type:complete